MITTLPVTHRRSRASGASGTVSRRTLAWTALGMVLVGLLWVLEHFASATVVPSVEGLSLDEAAVELHEEGIVIDVEGLTGTVIEQHPAAGEPWYRYKPFELVYVNDSGEHTISNH